MLSNILKLFKKTAGEQISRTQLSSELKTSLSFIESGCIAASINDRTVFVFKGDQDEINQFRKTERILIGLDCIKRLEFPSVRMYFELRDAENKPRLFDCFFGIESDREMESLKSLGDQDYFDMIFLDSEEIIFSKRVDLTEENKKKIKAALQEALS